MVASFWSFISKFMCVCTFKIFSDYQYDHCLREKKSSSGKSENAENPHHCFGDHLYYFLPTCAHACLRQWAFVFIMSSLGFSARCEHPSLPFPTCRSCLSLSEFESKDQYSMFGGVLIGTHMSDLSFLKCRCFGLQKVTHPFR